MLTDTSRVRSARAVWARPHSRAYESRADCGGRTRAQGWPQARCHARGPTQSAGCYCSGAERARGGGTPEDQQNGSLQSAGDSARRCTP